MSGLVLFRVCVPSAVRSNESSTPVAPSLDWLDLEVQRDQAEDQSLEVLHEVVKDAEALGVGRLGDIDKRSDLGRLERNVFVADPQLKLLPTVLVLLWPLCVVLLVDFAGLDNALDFLNHKRADIHLFANKAVVAVVGVVGIASNGTASVAEDTEVKLQKLVAETTRMAGAVELACASELSVPKKTGTPTSTAGRTARWLTSSWLLRCCTNCAGSSSHLKLFAMYKILATRVAITDPPYT